MKDATKSSTHYSSSHSYCLPASIILALPLFLVFLVSLPTSLPPSSLAPSPNIMARASGIPGNSTEWEDCMHDEGLDSGEIKVSDISYRSASKLDSRMFLCLKILVGRYHPSQLNVQAIVDASYEPPDFELLKDVIDKCDGQGDPFWVKGLKPNLFSLHQYLTHLVMNSEKIEPDDEASKLTIFQQYLQKKNEKKAIAAMKALSVSSPPPGSTASTSPPSASSTSSSSASPVVAASPSSNPQAQYEAVVNMSLVVFLSSIRLHSTELESAWVAHWHPDPKAFVLKNSQGQQLLQARVDGYLSRKGSRDAFAILETKPFVREAKRDDIERQEGAQMAAWIASDPRSKAPGVLRKANERDIRRYVVSYPWPPSQTTIIWS